MGGNATGRRLDGLAARADVHAGEDAPAAKIIDGWIHGIKSHVQLHSVPAPMESAQHPASGTSCFLFSSHHVMLVLFFSPSLDAGTGRQGGAAQAHYAPRRDV